MTFEEWFKQTSDYSYIGPEAEEAERAWNHQQAKIDAVLEYIDFWKDGNLSHDDLKELLK